MKTYPPQQTALEAYEEHQARIQKLLRRITAGIEAHDKNCHPRHNWGHVGDLESIEEILQDISDRLHGEGEYAEVALGESLTIWNLCSKIKLVTARPAPLRPGGDI